MVATSSRCLVVLVSGALGLAAGACGESSTPDPGNTAGAPAGGASGASSGGSAGSATAGTAAGIAGSPGGGAGGSGGSGSGGSAGAAGAAGAAGSGGSGGNANGTAMSFFVSSTPPSGSGDLDGLAGADQHCKTLATAAAAVRKEWFAYLSVAAGNINAKDRIGNGPWYNQKGEVFAANQAALHALPAITPNDMASRNAYIAAKPADALFMDENGATVPSDQHDILTGSNPDGTLMADNTCNDWTSSSSDDTASLGHSDTPGNAQYSPSWNAAHVSSGCSEENLVSTGGEGRIYCFATD